MRDGSGTQSGTRGDSREEPGRITRFLAAASLLAISLAATFLLAEIGCRIYITRVADNRNFLVYASIDQLKERKENKLPRYSPHRYLGFYPTPGFEIGSDRHNSLGYRGDEIPIPKPEGEFRIACLGGSTTYTTNPEDWRESYPAQLEKILRERGWNSVRVINGGAANWSSWETLINFQFRILDLEPDLIIVYQGINDVHSRLVWPPDAYRGDNAGRRSAPLAENALPGLLERSSLIRIILLRLDRTTPHINLERSLDPAPDTYYGEQFRFQVGKEEYPSGIFADVSAAEMLRTNQPVYFRRNVENLAAIASHHGVETVIATFMLSPLFKGEPRASSPEYVGSVARTNGILKEIAGKMNLHYYDFASIFPIDPEFFTDGRHVNPKGARLKARFFADYMVENQLLPPTGDR